MLQRYGCVAWAVAAAVLFGTAFAVAALDDVWKVPGAWGTIDFRYPDDIVEPLVDCPYEGVFPHPRNCTWYYRCYRNRMELGRRFWRAYFRCEAGTVFSDRLDQCVFESPTENCVPAHAVTCTDHVGNCSKQIACPEYRRKQQLYNKDVCTVAEVRCEDGAKFPMCPPTHIYEKDTKNCIARTKCLESENKEVVITIICKHDMEIPWTDSWRKISCRKNAMCTMNKGKPKYKGLQHLCTQYYQCELSGRRKLYATLKTCPSGEDYSLELKKCMSRTDDNFVCGTRKKASDDSPSSNSIVVDEETFRANAQISTQKAVEALFLTCSRHHQIPESEEVKKRNCRTTKICDESGKIVETELCDKFYVCRLTDDWKKFIIDMKKYNLDVNKYTLDIDKYTLDVRICHKGTMFSYEKKACVHTDECPSSVNNVLR